MNIQTRFNIGDNVCTIDKKTMKLHTFEVCSIMAYVNKEGKTDVSYRAAGDGYSGDSYNEDKCFANEAELLTYITTKADAQE